MQLQLWHIEGEAFHLGRHGLGQEESGDHLPSDSLLAALIARLAALHGSEAVKAWMDELRRDPPLLAITSAFPRAGEVLFFPAPLRLDFSSPEDLPPSSAPRPKDLKKVRFVSEAVFRRLLAGEPLPRFFSQGHSLQHGQVLLLPEEASRLPESVSKSGEIWHVEKRPRVTIDRVTSSSQIYHTGRTLYQPGCGLWFGVRWLEKNPQEEARLAALLADLGDAGLGGERSSGFGRARFTPAGSIELPDPAGGAGVTLSRYLPREDEIAALLDPRSAYGLVSVGGWIDSPAAAAQRRRAVNLLVEGSVIGPLPRPAPGQIVDVYPNYEGLGTFPHPVWRGGLCVLAGLAIPQQERAS